MISRMTYMYLKAIIFTSLVWFLVDVLVLLYFTDCNKTGIDYKWRQKVLSSETDQKKYAMSERDKDYNDRKEETNIKHDMIISSNKEKHGSHQGKDKAISQESDNKVEQQNPQKLLDGMLDKLIQKDTNNFDQNKIQKRRKKKIKRQHGKENKKGVKHIGYHKVSGSQFYLKVGDGGPNKHKAKYIRNAMERIKKVKHIKNDRKGNRKQHRKKRKHNHRKQKHPGKNGTRVELSKEEWKKARKSFKVHQFNLVASEMISLNRSLPDMRSKECQMKIYPDIAALPTTSVIIVFHNEAWSTLLRTVHSVINRSPHDLLEEIILVDDDSKLEHLGKKLEDHVEQLIIPVRILRFSPRIGLIDARIKGAKIATGETLTFLDSHCECTDGWLEPLLFEVYKDRTSVTSPQIDIIDDHNFAYIKNHRTIYGGFTWTLRFVWEKLAHRELLRTRRDPTLPVRTPTIAGGLFTINKDYFFAIGSFDKGMEIWGGDNLDISWRTWLCHGTLLISPCSRVGHVFRQQFYFKVPGKGMIHTLYKNYARVAEVWMDEWKDFFYKVNPKAKEVDHGNLTERLNIKHTVKCKSFKWYLENIYPEMLMPLEYKYLGHVKTNDNNTCLQEDADSKTALLDVVSCDEHFGEQVFCFTKEDLLMSDSRCVEYTQKKQVGFQVCNKNNLHQKWFYNKKNQHIVHILTKMCLDRIDSEEDFAEKVVLSPCKKHAKSQIWLLPEV